MALPLKEIVNVQLGVSSGGPGIAPEDVPVRGVGLNKYDSEIRVGDTDWLYPVFNPINSADRKVLWSSSDERIVTVSDEGQVTGVAIGTAFVTCVTEDGAYRATCRYVVIRALIPVTSITLSETAKTLEEGQSFKLTATVLPADADDKTVLWVSDKPAIATVDNNGNVVAISKGTANITAVNNVVSNPCVVTVTPPVVHVTNVQLDLTNIQLDVGKTQQLTATVLPTNADNKNVTWKSSATSIATVSSTGLVTCIAAGNATITVTTEDGGYSATCAVKVVVPVIAVTGVTIDNGSTADVDVGDTLQLSATVTPANATNKKVTWSTSNPDAVTVDATGLVTGVANGTGVVTVTTEDGGFTASITISVAVPHVAVTGVTITEGASGDVVSTKQLTAVVAPANATVKTVTWSSSDATVATVSNTGLVTALKPGATTITVTTTEGAFTATYDVTVPAVGSLTTDSIGNVLVGNSIQLTYTTNPAGAPLTDIVYSSSDEAVATVDANGLITVHTTGSPTISMSAKWYGTSVSDGSGLNNSYELSVTTASTSAIDKGTSATSVDATVEPDFAKDDPDYVLEYYSTDPAIATVDPVTGVITGVESGSCRVGARATVRNATASDDSNQNVN